MKDIDQHGQINDGYGKRFLLGPMYMLMDDLEGALQHFEWYEEQLGIEGECFQLMCWTLAMLRSGNEDEAKDLLRKTMLTNLYQIPRLLGIPIIPHPIWHSSNKQELDHLEYVPSELYDLWTDDELKWAEDMWESEGIKAIRDECIEIQRQLIDLPPSPERTAAVDRLSELYDCPL